MTQKVTTPSGRIPRGPQTPGGNGGQYKTVTKDPRGRNQPPITGVWHGWHPTRGRHDVFSQGDKCSWREARCNSFAEGKTAADSIFHFCGSHESSHPSASSSRVACRLFRASCTIVVLSARVLGLYANQDRASQLIIQKPSNPIPNRQQRSHCIPEREVRTNCWGRASEPSYRWSQLSLHRRQRLCFVDFHSPDIRTVGCRLLFNVVTVVEPHRSR